jgi:IS30 family transposase
MGGNNSIMAIKEIIKDLLNNDELKVVTTKEKIYSISKLKEEKIELQKQLDLEEPTDEELIETGKLLHPYWINNNEEIDNRIKEIDELLK